LDENKFKLQEASKRMRATGTSKEASRDSRVTRDAAGCEGEAMSIQVPFATQYVESIEWSSSGLPSLIPSLFLQLLWV